MRRSEAFSRHVVESPENHECIMHEARGEFSHEQCLAVKELASVLDEYDITVNYGYVTNSTCIEFILKPISFVFSPHRCSPFWPT